MKIKILHRDDNFILTHIVRPNELHQQTQLFLYLNYFLTDQKCMRMHIHRLRFRQSIHSL